jgi:hypothetical protein
LLKKTASIPHREQYGASGLGSETNHARAKHEAVAAFEHFPASLAVRGLQNGILPLVIRVKMPT